MKEETEVQVAKPKRKPDWLRVKLPTGQNYKNVRNIVGEHKLHTICESGNCPNMGECWGAGTATFMILGNTCTQILRVLLRSFYWKTRRGRQVRASKSGPALLNSWV